MARLLVQARSASVQASSPSAQDKAAAAQVGDCTGTGEKNSVIAQMKFNEDILPTPISP